MPEITLTKWTTDYSSCSLLLKSFRKILEQNAFAFTTALKEHRDRKHLPRSTSEKSNTLQVIRNHHKLGRHLVPLYRTIYAALQPNQSLESYTRLVSKYDKLLALFMQTGLPLTSEVRGLELPRDLVRFETVLVSELKKEMQMAAQEKTETIRDLVNKFCVSLTAEQKSLLQSLKQQKYSYGLESAMWEYSRKP